MNFNGLINQVNKTKFLLIIQYVHVYDEKQQRLKVLWPQCGCTKEYCTL